MVQHAHNLSAACPHKNELSSTAPRAAGRICVWGNTNQPLHGMGGGKTVQVTATHTSVLQHTKKGRNGVMGQDKYLVFNVSGTALSLYADYLI